MAITQISVLVENAQGKLASAAKSIADANVNMRAMSIADTAEYGILRLIVDDADKAKVALSEQHAVTSTAVIAAKMDDTKGALYGILKVLDEAGINIAYMYAFTGSDKLSAYTVLRVDDVKAAEEVLASKGIATLTDADIKAM